MDKNVPSPKKTSSPAWVERFTELREMGVPIVRICKDLNLPRSTVYARLAALKKAKQGDAA